MIYREVGEIYVMPPGSKVIILVRGVNEKNKPLRLW